MTGIEILKTHPLSADKMKQFLLDEVLESCKNDPSLPPEFVEYVIETGVDMERMAEAFDQSARMLFDFFDTNGIYIQILKGVGADWFSLVKEETSGVCGSRKEADLAGVIAAFKFLEAELVLLQGQSESTNDLNAN